MKNTWVLVAFAALSNSNVLGWSRDVSCGTPMVNCGHRRMGYATSSSGSGYVRLTRNGGTILCGSAVTEGETLGLSTRNLLAGSDILIEVLQASSISSSTARCGRTRSLTEDVTVVVPSYGSVSVQVRNLT
mmetsp:Transcript_35746/g.93769  ORF Transcript_35746/g.93769 Transcript_35746/m.93769 type:complete len:131 (+) Transcript_35746:149-541(+)